MELVCQRRKRSGSRDATPRSAIERYIPRRPYQLHLFNAAIGEDDELNRHRALFQQRWTRGFRNQQVPTGLRHLDNLMKIWTEINPHRVA